MVKVMSDRTVSGPRGVEYCFPTFDTSRTSWAEGTASGYRRAAGRPALAEPLVDLEQTGRRLLDGVMGADAVERAHRETVQGAAIAPEAVEPFGHAVGAAWIDQESAARLVDDLDESAAPRLDDRHPARHRFEEEHPL